MEELGVIVWAMAAEEVRMLYHACRGESEAVQRCLQRVELFAVQGNTTWQSDIFWPFLRLDSATRAGDAIAARTIHEQLSRRAKEHRSLQSFADVAHAAYLTLRGDHTAAIAAFERIIDHCGTLSPALSWPTFRASVAYAQALNAVGEHARAKRYLTESLERAGADVTRLVMYYLEPQRQLALAEAGLGNHAEAVRLLDALLCKYGAQDHPLLIGLLHKARAEVALSMSDAERFSMHFTEMEQCFRRSQNPALIAQLARTARLALASEQDSSGIDHHAVAARFDAMGGATRRSDVIDSARALYEISLPAERAAKALGLILKEVAAKSGFLYVLKDDRMELAAASSHADPAPQLERALQAVIQQAQQSLLDHDQETALNAPSNPTSQRAASSDSIDSLRPASSVHPKTDDDTSCRFLVLRTGTAADSTVVGGVILEIEPRSGFAADMALLLQIACALRDCATSDSRSVSA
jgi:tetratricopeptide (TPR) repeat protein